MVKQGYQPKKDTDKIHKLPTSGSNVKENNNKVFFFEELKQACKEIAETLASGEYENIDIKFAVDTSKSDFTIGQIRITKNLKEG